MVNIIKKIWDKTIFPDMIKKKNEDRQLREELRKEILTESRDDIKKQLKDEIVKKEVDRLKGGGGLKAFAQKMQKGFEDNTKFANQDKMDMMLGRKNSNNSNVKTQDKLSNFPNSEKITNMIGGGTLHNDSKINDIVKSQKKKTDKLSDDKIRELLK